MIESAKVLEKGKELCIFLYTFRGLSAALPVAPNIVIELSENPSDAEKAAARREREKKSIFVKSRNFDILTPYILKLDDLYHFSQNLSKVLVDFLSLFVADHKQDIVPSHILQRAVQLVDILAQVDNLKDIKVCDFVFHSYSSSCQSWK